MARRRSRALVRPISNVAWELRGAWARGRRVALRIDGDVRRVEGFVERVSPTSSFCVVAGLHVPLDRILTVLRPSRLGDSTAGLYDDWAGPIPAAIRDRDPRQGTFDV